MFKRSFVLFVLMAALSFALIACGDSDVKDNGDGSTLNGSEDDLTQNGDSESEGAEEIPSDGTDNGVTDDTESEENGDTENKDDVKDENTEDQEGVTDGENTDTSEPSIDFVYSITSKKFHLPDCYHVASISEEKRIDFIGTVSELSEKGLTPCKSCKPDPDYDYEALDDGTSEEENFDYDYVVNISTMKFHLPTCSAVETMNDENRQYTNDSRSDLIFEGYTPCGTCKP